ncbi:MAG TPA: FAD-dependent oxidoreductase, partial [Desulfobulbus sp.]|nr:FAD-dependent oxidoreductase [Desulfobulbus sp.]
DDVLARVPMLSALQGLTGAQVLFESHMHSSERMTLAFLKTAVANGARVANYLAVTDLLAQGGRVEGARVRDRLGHDEFEIRARLVVNSAGPFVQQVNRSLPGLRLHHRLTGFSRGVHLVTRQLEPRYALALTTRKKTEGLITRGGRHFFVIPWRGRSLIGTTNVPVEGELDQIRVTARDVTDFLQDINEALPEANLAESDVHYAFTGIYPIIAREIKPDTYQGTGAFQIVDHAKKDGVQGIITALGAKFTTARRVAALAVDLAMKRLERRDPGCATSHTPLAEGEIPDIRAFVHQCQGRYAGLLAADVTDELIRNHGREINALVRLGRETSTLEPVAPGRHTMVAEIEYAVRNEMARTLEDVVFRRTGLGTIGNPGREALERCAAIMAGHLGWDKDEQARQLAMVEDRYRYR